MVDRAKNRPTLRARRAEREYARALKQLAAHVGGIVAGFKPGDQAAVPTITRMMRTYADALRPWAVSVARRMLEDVNVQEERQWRERSKDMGLALRNQLRNAPVGQAVDELLALQVELITSIPLEAAERVQRLSMEALENSTRADEIAKEILRSSEVTQSRAMLIARTETSRAVSALTQVRAESIGSIGYIWRTSQDGDVRASHKAMAGKFVRWDDPPTLDNLTGHAGCLPNCRCYVEPVLPD